jgi:MFS superfamily sulfate permease-like transporter
MCDHMFNSVIANEFDNRIRDWTVCAHVLLQRFCVSIHPETIQIWVFLRITIFFILQPCDWKIPGMLLLTYHGSDVCGQMFQIQIFLRITVFFILQSFNWRIPDSLLLTFHSYTYWPVEWKMFRAIIANNTFIFFILCRTFQTDYF